MQRPRTTPSTPEKFENATPSVRLGVPFTLHENGTVRKRSLNRRNTVFVFEGKRSENKALRKRCSRVND